MNRKFIGIGVYFKWMIGALTLATASVSHANSNTLVGGGSTLSAIGYVGVDASFELQVMPPDVYSASLFGVYTAQSSIAVSYCQTGSGAGKNIFAGLPATPTMSAFNVQLSCVQDSTGTVHGFGAPAANRTDLTQPNFVAADAPLAINDFTNYVNNHPAGYFPTQFPTIAGAIAIAFNLTDSFGNKVEANFSDTQLCEIFSGQVTYWNDTSLASAFTLPAGDRPALTDPDAKLV